MLSKYFNQLKNLSQIFRALNNRNYQLFFFGQGISLIGNWMQMIAMGWLVYRMTNSSLLLGVIGFAGQIPMLLIMPFAGVFSDRWQRQRVLIITQSLSMLQALLLAALTLTGVVQVWHLITLAIFAGVINSFDMPTRQAFTVEMIDRKEDLANAIALNSTLFNASRLVGPTIAGALIALVGEGACFLINGISFLAVIAALLAMRLKPKPRRVTDKNVFQDLQAGLAYAFGFLPIRNILLLLALISLVGSPLTVLLPVFAKDILHGSPNTLGFLSAGLGAGALAGALYLAMRKTILGLPSHIPVTAACFGVGLIGFSFSQQLLVSLLALALAGFGMMVGMAASNTILQTIAEEDKHGRLMSLYSLAFAGTAPIGSLIAGASADRLGSPLTLAIGGVCSILGAGLFILQLPQLRALIRPIYRQKGILPMVAKGLESANEPVATTPKG